MIFDYDTLEMLFNEVGISFDEWIADSGYTDSMTDQQIYSLLPNPIKEALYDFGINASWLHDGM